MRVTDCELSNDPQQLAREWEKLTGHVLSSRSDLVLLLEMPFFPWRSSPRTVDPSIWKQSVAAHDAWLRRLSDLSPAVVLGTRPVVRNGRRFNQGFAGDPAGGRWAVHDKTFRRYVVDGG